jgi:integrase/recombinase XerD
VLATQRARVAKTIDNQCVMRSDPQRPKRFGSLKTLIINELCVATQVFERSIYMGKNKSFLITEKMKHLVLKSERHETLLTQFTAYLTALGYGQNTILALPVYIRALMFYLEGFEGFENLSVETANTKTLLDYKTHLSERPNQRKAGNLSISEQRHHLWAIRLFYRFMEQTRIIDTNPTHALKYPTLDPTERTLLTQEDIQILYESCQTQTQRAILALLYGCGLRRTEAVKLTLKDIDFRQNLLYVRSGKGKKRRVIPLSIETKNDLYKYAFNTRIALMKPLQRLNIQYNRLQSVAFLLNQNGKNMTGNTLAKNLEDLRKQSPIATLTCHTLRHAIATHLLENGLSVEQVRDFLGHQQLETTQIYTHVKRRAY